MINFEKNNQITSPRLTIRLIVSLHHQLSHDRDSDKPSWQLRSLSKVLQLETERATNPVIQRVKLIMSVGLMLIHIISRWPISEINDSLLSNSTSNALNQLHDVNATASSSTGPTQDAHRHSEASFFEHQFHKWFTISFEQLVLFGLVFVLITKYIYDSKENLEEEVRAHHILLADEDAAKRLIADLKGGADFEALAKQHSTDPSAKEGGGDLGFFKRADMLPEFADAAWALKPGEVSQAPVKTRFGWHVIKLDERRQSPPPPFEQVRDELRQTMIQDGVRKVLEQAKTGVSIERFNPDGTPQAPAPAVPAPGARPAAPGQPPAR